MALRSVRRPGLAPVHAAQRRRSGEHSLDVDRPVRSAADPAQPLPYYLKGQGLIQKATVDPATGKMILPPGCAEAYAKYLQLAPTGPYAGDVKGILDQANQKVDTSYKAPKPAKK